VLFHTPFQHLVSHQADQWVGFVLLFEEGRIETMINNTQQAWQTTLEQLQLQMTKATFDTWMKNTQIVDLEDNTYTIGVQNAFAKDWLENRLSGTIKRALGNTAGAQVHVKFVVLPGHNNQDKGTSVMAQEEDLGIKRLDESTYSAKTRSTNGHAPPGRNASTGLGVNMKLSNNYTFDRFVVGPSNRLAHAASLAVSDTPVIP
jgi:chromosomal replication initiator protein